MRLKTFHAASMADAMQMIRDSLGDDAMILSQETGPGGNGVQVTAALDLPEEPEWIEAEAAEEEREDPVSAVTRSLQRHGVTAGLADRMLTAATTLGAETPVMAMAGALDAVFRFSPLPEPDAGNLLMLVGPPGAGKTLTISKLATRSVMARRPVRVITTDTHRAGAIEQLSAFTRLLQVELRAISSPDKLVAALRLGQKTQGLTVIDSPGLNPFDRGDMSELVQLLEVAEIEPILVLPAGGDGAENAEIAEAFRMIGVRRLLATRVDIARRLGGILVAAFSARLKLTDIGISADVADGLTPINPVSLARLLLPERADLGFSQSNRRALA